MIVFNKIKLIRVVLIFLLCILIQTNVYASDFIADGTGPTEKAAIQDSFRNALENVVGMIVDSRTYVKNSQVIRDQIYSRTDGYIRGYTILKSSTENTLCKVQTRVTIDTNPDSNIMSVLEKLKTVEIGINNPRITVIITSQDNRKNDETSVQNSIVEVLRNNGFSRVVDSTQLNQIVKERIEAAASVGDYETISLLGTQEQIDYIIVGSINSNQVYTNFKTSTKIDSFRTVLNANLYKCDTAEIIGAGQFTGSGVDVTQEVASENAKFNTGKDAGKFFSNKLLNYAAIPIKNITLYIHNIKDSSELQNIESYISNIAGIGTIYTRNYANNTAVVDINFTGDTQTLSDYINQDKELIGEITKITNSTLDFNLK